MEKMELMLVTEFLVRFLANMLCSCSVVFHGCLIFFRNLVIASCIMHRWMADIDIIIIIIVPRVSLQQPCPVLPSSSLRPRVMVSAKTRSFHGAYPKK